MKYCEFCGTALEDNAHCSCAQAEKARIKSDKLKKLLHNKVLIAIVAAIAITAIVVSVFLISGNRADPFDYITVSFEGLNGNGRIVIDIDKQEMADMVYGQTKDPESLEDFEDMIEFNNRKNDFKNDISYTVDIEEGLSNGDVVTVTVTCGELASKHFKSASKTFTAEGLVELEEIDAFADLEISIEGANGDATIELKNNSNNPFLRSIRYSADIINNISNGQTITITAEYDEEYAIECGVMPAVDTKVITVSGLPEYVTSAEQLTAEELNNAIQYFVDERNKVEDDFMFSYDDAFFYASYFQVETSENISTYFNVLTIYIGQKEYLRGELYGTNYFIQEFKNIMIASDGTVVLDPEKAYQSTFTTEIEATVQKLFENKSYTTTKVDAQ